MKNIAKAKKTPIKNILGNFKIIANTPKMKRGMRAKSKAILMSGGTLEIIQVHTKIKNTIVKIMKEDIVIPKINIFFFLLEENLTKPILGCMTRNFNRK